MSRSSDIVTLDVGGHIYRTTKTTLTRYPDSMFGAMFGGDLETLQDDQGRYFIDRNGRMFEHILNFLRTSQLVLPEDFKELPLFEMEADFYQIQPLIEALKTYKASIYQRCAHDFVSLSYSGAGSVSVGATSKEIEVMVNDMAYTLHNQLLADHRYLSSGPGYQREIYLASLLKRLLETGFTTVQTFGAYQWVMVRKTSVNS